MPMFSGIVGPIGVDVGHTTVRAAQVRWRGGRPTLIAGMSWPLRTPGAFTPDDVSVLAGAMDRAGFIGRDVVAAAPSRALLTTTMELPPRSSAAPLQQLARMELARIHRCEPQSLELGMWDMPTPDRKPGATHAMVVGLPTDAGEAITGVFASAGLRLVCLDVPMCGLARVCEAAVAGVPSLVGVLDVGWTCCRVTLMHIGSAEGTLPVYERRVEEVTLEALSKSVEERLGLSRDAVRVALRTSAEDVAADSGARELLRHARAFQAEFLDRLVPEVQRSFSYAVQMYPSMPMTTLLVTGEGEGIRGLRERLANALGLDVRSIQPSDAVGTMPHSTIAKDASLVPALGLAMVHPSEVAATTRAGRAA